MPIYNRSGSGSGGGGSQEEGGGGSQELAELQAKRTRGNVTADNVFGTVGQLDSNPPPKARPRAHESHEEKPETEIDGFEVAAVPFAVHAIDYEDLRAPYGGEDLEGMSVKELKALLKKRGLKVGGTKSELISRLQGRPSAR